MRGACLVVLAVLLVSGCAEPSVPAATIAAVPPVRNPFLSVGSEFHLGDPPYISAVAPTKDAPTKTSVYTNVFYGAYREPNQAVWRLKFEEAMPLQGLTVSLMFEITQPSVQRLRGTINLGDCTWGLSVEIPARAPRGRVGMGCNDAADPYFLPQTLRVEWNVGVEEGFKVQKGEVLQLQIHTNLVSREPGPSVFALTNHTKEPATLKIERASGFGPTS